MANPQAIVEGACTGAAMCLPTIWLGVHVDALVVGLMAAVCVSMWLEVIDSRIKAAFAVLFAALLAGYGSPVAVDVLASTVPSAAHHADELRMLMALLIGGATPSLWPIGLRVAGRKVGAQ